MCACVRNDGVPRKTHGEAKQDLLTDFSFLLGRAIGSGFQADVLRMHLRKSVEFLCVTFLHLASAILFVVQLIFVIRMAHELVSSQINSLAFFLIFFVFVRKQYHSSAPAKAMEK